MGKNIPAAEKCPEQNATVEEKDAVTDLTERDITKQNYGGDKKEIEELRAKCGEKGRCGKKGDK